MSDARTAAVSAKSRAVAFVESLNDAAKEGVRCEFVIELDNLSGTFSLKRFTAFEALKLDN